MKNIGINKPCSENWNKMTTTEQGKFCQKCSKTVQIDEPVEDTNAQVISKIEKKPTRILKMKKIIEIEKSTCLVEKDIVMGKMRGPVQQVELQIQGEMMSSQPHYVAFLKDTVSEVETPTEYDENGLPFPSEYNMKIFPNPVVNIATFKTEIPQKGLFYADLYDLTGKFIKTIYNGELDRGRYSYRVDFTALNSGIYMIVVRSKDFNQSIRVSKI